MSGTVVRAVYDIGSGSTKLLVAEVDVKTLVERFDIEPFSDFSAK